MWWWWWWWWGGGGEGGGSGVASRCIVCDRTVVARILGMLNVIMFIVIIGLGFLRELFIDSFLSCELSKNLFKQNQINGYRR